MKRVLKYVFIFVFFATVLISCNPNTNERQVDKNKEQSTPEVEVASFSAGLVKPHENLCLNDNRLSIDYFINNGNEDCNIGILIFIDGIVQKYNVKGNSEEYLHKFKMKKNSNTNFTLNLTPYIDNSSDKNDVYITTMLNPSFLPDAQHPSFGVNNKLSNPIPLSLNDSTHKVSPNNGYNNFTTEIITDETRNQYMMLDNKTGLKKCTLDTITDFNLCENTSNNTNQINIKKGEKINLIQKGLGGDNTTYRTTVFIDHKPIKINYDYDYSDITIIKNKISQQKFQIETGDLSGKHIIYSISVPIGSDYTKANVNIVKTSSMVLTIS